MGISREGSERNELREDSRRAQFRGDERISTITNLDDLDVTRATEKETASDSNKRRTKMEQAKEFEGKMSEELGTIMQGIEDEVDGLGIQVVNAPKYQGMEKFLYFIGQKERASVRHLRRLKEMNLQEKVDRVFEHGKAAIVGLGKIETRHVEDVGKYDTSLKNTLRKYKEAQPEYKRWQETRSSLEIELNGLNLELQAGTVSETERPAKEVELDELKKKLHKAEMEEKSYLAIVTDAQRTIPIVQNSRDGAQKEIEAIHVMRRALLEKLENVKVMFETAMTNVITKAELERVRVIDPTINRTTTLIAEHNEKTAGAVLELVAERLNKAAVDPAKSAELISNLMGHMKEFAQRMDAIAEEAERGNRVPAGNGADGASASDFPNDDGVHHSKN